jgi:hypothetical protein
MDAIWFILTQNHQPNHPWHPVLPSNHTYGDNYARDTQGRSTENEYGSRVPNLLD